MYIKYKKKTKPTTKIQQSGAQTTLTIWLRTVFECALHKN